MLTDTRFGLVSTVRLGLAMLLAVLLLWPATRLLQIVAGAGLIGLIALVGHAGATPGTAGDIHLASDIVHLLAAGAWLGGLPALAMLLAAARQANDPAWRSLAIGATRRFSCSELFAWPPLWRPALLIAGIYWAGRATW